jgi:hypothetical protein
VDPTLREELIAMRDEDLCVREELLQTGELGRGYAPRMEAIHRRNAWRLREIISEHGWPDRELVGADGTLAAWLIAQHAIGEPDFQRPALALVREKVEQGKVPAAQEAYLLDRIAMYEGRPQSFGTQSLPCADGKYRRWKTEDPQHLNERRIAVGMPAVADEYLEWLRGYEDWLRRTGWR